MKLQVGCLSVNGKTLSGDNHQMFFKGFLKFCCKPGMDLFESCINIENLAVCFMTTWQKYSGYLHIYSQVLNTRGGLNNWGGGNMFWKLIREGVLFNKRAGNPNKLGHVEFFIIFQLILFTQFSQSIFLFQCVLPSFSTIKCAISHDNCTKKSSVKVSKSCVLYLLQDLSTYKN